MISTRTAEIYLAQEGYIVVEIKEGIEQSLVDAQDNIQACWQVGQGKRLPIVVDISKAKKITAEVRHFYGGDILAESFSAIAVVVKGNSMGIIMGNLYFSIAQFKIPKKLFTDRNAAFAWVRKYV